MLLAGPTPCQTAFAPGEHNAVINGIRLWYKVAGEARPGQAPLLYLAGGPGYNSYSFEKTIGEQLERHAQMIYFDERGTGRSERPVSKDYALPTLVEDIEALRRSLDIPQLSLMGQSFGGAIAIEYAARYPEHVQKLILVDGVSDIPEVFTHWQSELEARYPAAWKTAVGSEDGKLLSKAEQGGDTCSIVKARFRVEMDVLAKVDSSEFHHWQQFHDQRFEKEQAAIDAQSGLRNTGEMSNAYFSPDNDFLCYRFTAYSQLTMPILAITGKYDGAVDPEQQRSFAQHVKRGQFDEFENSAHFPYAEEPERFEQVISDFLSDASASSEN